MYVEEVMMGRNGTSPADPFQYQPVCLVPDELELFGRHTALLAEQLEAAAHEAGVGEYDGDEYGGGECILFFCGPDEEAMLGVLRPLLQRSPLARGAHFVRLVESEDGEMRRENLRI